MIDPLTGLARPLQLVAHGETLLLLESEWAGRICSSGRVMCSKPPVIPCGCMAELVQMGQQVVLKIASNSNFRASATLIGVAYLSPIISIVNQTRRSVSRVE